MSSASPVQADYGMLPKLCRSIRSHTYSHKFPADQPQSRSPSPSGGNVLTLRPLVSTKDAGVIIGKAGKNVAELREQTAVKAGVSKVIPGVHERVLTVTGSVDGVAKVCFACCIYARFMHNFTRIGLHYDCQPTIHLSSSVSRFP